MTYEPAGEYDFSQSLAKSQSHHGLPMWERVYRTAFPDMRSMHEPIQTAASRFTGIDRFVTLNSGKVISIDEKVRSRNIKTGMVYRDIALEYLSDEGRNRPGWVCKKLRCDYICYAIIRAGTAYLLPVAELQEAWRKHGQEWIQQYRPMKAQNRDHKTGRTWTTASVAVPSSVILETVKGAMEVVFDPLEADETGQRFTAAPVYDDGKIAKRSKKKYLKCGCRHQNGQIIESCGPHKEMWAGVLKAQTTDQV